MDESSRLPDICLAEELSSCSCEFWDTFAGETKAVEGFKRGDHFPYRYREVAVRAGNAFGKCGCRYSLHLPLNHNHV